MHTPKINWLYVVIAIACFVGTICVLGVSETKTEDGSVIAFKQSPTENAEEHAEELLRALYGKRVVFRREIGSGTDFTTRYYCSNVCIDACADGSVRYLCDIRSAGGADPLLTWLFGQEKVQLVRSSRQYGMEYREMQSAKCFAEICVNLQTERVFAAKITFNS
ncbi:MAG: hypothetical protein IJB19_04725 [Clostridia bacterium]|nr:hypothetical protein [Clostridia bacterium]